MEEEYEVQKRIFDSIKMQLPNDDSLVQVLMDTLYVSQDAAYRRLRGKVELTLSETRRLCQNFKIDFNVFGNIEKGRVEFTYNPLDRRQVNFKSYLIGMREDLRRIKNLEDPRLLASVNDTPIFQLFNLPDLTRFKFFFWAKTYLKIPEFDSLKFANEKIDNEVLQISIEAHNLYNSIPSTEIYSPESLRGTLRQILYYFDARLFEDPHYALKLLDDLIKLLMHMKKQAEVGRKFALNNEPVTSGNEFQMYSNDTYIYDNTYFFEWNGGSAVYFSHNIMNYLTTADPHYTKETKLILDQFTNNSCLISQANAKERNRFFGNIEQTILKVRRKIELELEIE
ncbi:MAG: hypothetical protein GQ574_21255 [Crocinitomix sp.]|nr:hypothetical protein [Crocinitomix sp.]